ncbi:hypothetical protein [Armatimonas sp.]|uniref:hypothetical protein n=1 Tax=Armatimonas sp. TaxID=1872638 RepID=UPI00286BE145|nr:hypothetical protein [Armatimonas sp.]
MAYSDFTVETLQTKLGISLREVSNSFESVTAISPSQPLVAMLERGMPVVLGANKEKARSEWLIAPLLLEVREVRLRQISVFSGSDFKVDPKQGLSGFCDFLISRSPLQMAVESPVVAIVEAKHEDLNAGIPQCLAAMYAARLFNEKRGKSLETVYGATTSGTVWRFLRLTGMQAESDLTEYHIHEVGKILGILVHMAA